jgi:hypothetical protein
LVFGILSLGSSFIGVVVVVGKFFFVVVFFMAVEGRPPQVLVQLVHIALVMFPLLRNYVVCLILLFELVEFVNMVFALFGDHMLRVLVLILSQLVMFAFFNNGVIIFVVVVDMVIVRVIMVAVLEIFTTLFF